MRPQVFGYEGAGYVYFELVLAGPIQRGFYQRSGYAGAAESLGDFGVCQAQDFAGQGVIEGCYFCFTLQFEAASSDDFGGWLFVLEDLHRDILDGRELLRSNRKVCG